MRSYYCKSCQKITTFDTRELVKKCNCSYVFENNVNRMIEHGVRRQDKTVNEVMSSLVKQTNDPDFYNEVIPLMIKKVQLQDKIDYYKSKGVDLDDVSRQARAGLGAGGVDSPAAMAPGVGPLPVDRPETSRARDLGREAFGLEEMVNHIIDQLV